MQLNKTLLTIAVAGVVVSLSACGGGGSSSNSTPGGGGNGNSANDPYKVSDWYHAGQNNRMANPALDSVGQPTAGSPDLQDAAYTFTASSPDMQGAAYAIDLTAVNSKFVATDYIGAFAQDSADNWTSGWTVWLNGNDSVWQPATGGTLAGVTPMADGTCPAGTTDIGDQVLPASVGGASMDLCQLAARYTTDVSLTNDNVYALASGFPGTYIGNGEAADGDSANNVNVTLTIEPGTLIVGATREALSVTRGSQINAVGTAVDPIVFTSRTQLNNWVGGDATSGRGEWAGLALMGYAKTNECGVPCDVAAEGNIGAYGGTDDTDNSGTLKYVVIRHAGNDLDGNGNELNGLTLFATGSGTSVDYVQVHKNLDDGVEHFGASDFMSHLVLTANKDDSFDWGQGYTGGAQFIVIKQDTDTADRGIEADNDRDNSLITPVSAPTLANMTIMSRGTADSKGEQGILLRRGTGAKIYNSVITGFRDSCIDMDDADTLNMANTLSDSSDSSLEIFNSIIYCPTSVSFKDDGDVAVADITTWFNADGSNRITNPNLDSIGMPNSPSGAGTKFVSTDYVGAFPQDSSDNWTAGWTVWLNGNDSVWEPATGGTLAGATPAADSVCPAGTTDIGDQTLPVSAGGGTMDLCQLAARYTTDVTLTNDNVYALASGFPGTYIGNGEAADGDSSNDINVTLTIEPGTLIVGAASEALSVTRGSQINAVGTAVDPIVFTSRSQLDNWVNNADATSGRGEWAGLALMGYAKTNECGTPCDVAAEGNIGAYGGTDDTDDSGSLKYVVIRHAGNDIDGNGNELNGLTLFATGSGTDIDYIQVHKNLDDGVEHFGSADFMSHLVLTANKDDSFDWGQGYTGGAQFIVVKQDTDTADRGIEADNDRDSPLATPVSMPTLANMTFMSAGTTDGKSEQGILLRRGTGAKIWNTIVTGFSGSCIDIDDAATFSRAGSNAPSTLSGDLVMNNSIVSCTTDFDEE
ncbi:MAG: hypothetical protein GXP17_01570 [Gammaproteobacteria bacterium]|nr:hypothetical protein [Gammaproteobacteria bacterium]